MVETNEYSISNASFTSTPSCGAAPLASSTLHISLGLAQGISGGALAGAIIGAILGGIVIGGLTMWGVYIVRQVQEP